MASLSAFPDICIDTVAPLTQDGYGRLSLGSTQGRTKESAHRLIYRIFIGEIPQGMVVRHTCDNPACCNPKHLVLGTQKDNVDDAVLRGRHPKREHHGRAKLTAKQASEIRESKEPSASLARIFHVSEGLIRQIRRNEIWAKED